MARVVVVGRPPFADEVQSTGTRFLFQQLTFAFFSGAWNAVPVELRKRVELGHEIRIGHAREEAHVENE